MGRRSRSEAAGYARSALVRGRPLLPAAFARAIPRAVPAAFARAIPRAVPAASARAIPARARIPAAIVRHAQRTCGYRDIRGVDRARRGGHGHPGSRSALRRLWRRHPGGHPGSCGRLLPEQPDNFAGPVLANGPAHFHTERDRSRGRVPNAGKRVAHARDCDYTPARRCSDCAAGDGTADSRPDSRPDSRADRSSGVGFRRDLPIDPVVWAVLHDDHNAAGVAVLRLRHLV